MCCKAGGVPVDRVDDQAQQLIDLCRKGIRLTFLSHDEALGVVVGDGADGGVLERTMQQHECAALACTHVLYCSATMQQCSVYCSWV